MKRITVYLTERQIATIETLTGQTGLKFAEVLRRLIDQALEAQALRSSQDVRGQQEC